MRSTRIFKSDSFRIAGLFALLFLGFTGILIGTVLVIVEGAQRAALIGANEADISTIINGFNDEGLPEAVEVVKQRLGSALVGRTAYPDVYILVESAGGEKIAGNLPVAARRLGNVTIPVAETGGKRGNRRILGQGIEMSQGVYVFVGRDTMLMVATRERIFRAFLWVVLGAAMIATVGGLFLGFRFVRRVDAIADTCKAVIAGRFDERIPLLGREDEWDRLSGAINDMLNRISALLDNLRQVSSDVAHDLRTPLTRMRSRLEQARLNATSADDYSAAVATALEDMDALLSMFAAVLRISQVEAGARLAGFSTVSLTKILENLQQIYTPVAEDYDHVLEATIQTGIFILGDAELLTQMFSNLLENAIRHTPKKTRIRLGLRVEQGRPAAFVTDDGPGIDPAVHEKVLRRFYRVSSDRSTTGHGLGLALVAAIAQLHQAKLQLADARPGLEVTTEFLAQQMP